jgi:DNA-binding response OmpR family regulator
MNHKVLLADDSLTIQKVIKITLANQPFDIVDCSSEDELFKKLPQVKPELVFLDFNLSEKYSGYELVSKIKAIVPSARVLLLVGTFDTIDDAALERCGASDKIVKPFDSNKFIAICKRLVDTAPIEKMTFPEYKTQEVAPQENEEDQWKVTHTIEQQIQPEEPKASFDVRNHLNPLDQEVSDWGMSIPGVINDASSHPKKIDLPPVIGDVKSIQDHKSKLEVKASPLPTPKSDIKFPDNDDLDYPTIEQLNEKAPAQEAKPAPKSKLISIESFNQEPEIEFQIEHSINSMEETDVLSIEAQIRDEVEEDLWKVDEFEELKKEVAAKIDEVKNNIQTSNRDFDENMFKPIDEHEILWNTSDQVAIEIETPAVSNRVVPEVNMQDLRSEMEEMIKKHVKEYMDEMFKQKVEKISWEIIPDLAENLIRQEMSKISNKILNETK